MYIFVYIKIQIYTCMLNKISTTNTNASITLKASNGSIKVLSNNKFYLSLELASKFVFYRTINETVNVSHCKSANGYFRSYIYLYKEKRHRY